MRVEDFPVWSFTASTLIFGGLFIVAFYVPIVSLGTASYLLTGLMYLSFRTDFEIDEYCLDLSICIYLVMAELWPLILAIYESKDEEDTRDF